MTPIEVKDFVPLPNLEVDHLPDNAKKRMKEKYSIDATILLIKSVQERPALWHKEFLRTRVAASKKDWENIQQQVFNSLTIPQLKVRWKTLRDGFRRELRLLEEGGQLTSDWMYFDHLSFLKGQFRIKQRSPPKQTVVIKKQYTRKRLSFCDRAMPIPELVAPQPTYRETLSMAGSAQVVRPAGDHGPYPDASSTCALEEKSERLSDFGEVTFGNRFRSRIKSRESSYEEKINPECMALPRSREDIEADSDSSFLASLASFMRHLSPRRNLDTRMQMLQLLHSAINNN